MYNGVATKYIMMTWSLKRYIGSNKLYFMEYCVFFHLVIEVATSVGRFKIHVILLHFCIGYKNLSVLTKLYYSKLSFMIVVTHILLLNQHLNSIQDNNINVY